MLVLCDYRLKADAKSQLSVYGEVVLFKSALPASHPLSGHPDIYICQTPTELICAPNINPLIFDQICKEKTPIVIGQEGVGDAHPGIARYNAVVTSSVTITNPKTVDSAILDLHHENKIISVKQSYNRCSTIAISDDSFITSDSKTHQILQKNGLKSVFVNPKNIVLKGYNHGLFGGCCGIFAAKKLFFVVGSIDELPNKSAVLAAISEAELTFVALGSGYLQDVGGLFFIS